MPAFRSSWLSAEVTFGGSTAVVRGQRVEGTTKGGRSRTISLDRDTVAVLREHRRQQAEERLTAGSAWNDNGGLVFVTRWGEPLYPDTVTALMTKLISAYNRSITPRPRHSPMPGCTICATCTRPCCFLAGVPVHVVAARLGHADPAVTLRVYSHVLREHAAGVGDIFAQAVKAAVSKSASHRQADQ